MKGATRKLGLLLRGLTALLFLMLSVGCASTPKSAPPARPDLPLFDLTQYESVQNRLGQSEDTTVVVAISGGGFRAANLGIGALLAMEHIELTIGGKRTNLLAEVDYFTTVSGGGYAPGLYLQGLLSTPEEKRQRFRLGEHLRRVKDGEKIESDRLPSIQKTLFWRIAGYLFYPGVIGSNLDRGDLLQNRLDSTILKRASCDDASFRAGEFCSWTLDDVFKVAGEGVAPITPYWITNATNYTNGEIFSFTPDNICSRDIKAYKHQLDDVDTYCKKWPEISGLPLQRKSLARGVPLALGMRTSSNFPMGLPATTLTLNDKSSIQLSDGGQSDNLAFYSALEILFHEAQRKSQSKQPGQGEVPRRILVLIDAFKGSLANSEDTEGSPNFAQAALRSPNLPLDALRSRIRASVRQVGVDRRSEVDSVLMDMNLAVAYISIDQEPYARDVGTTLWIDEVKQDRLIEAGFRQAYTTLTGECPRKVALESIGLTVSCVPSSNSANLQKPGLIEFNSGLLEQRKRDIHSLKRRTVESLAQSIVGLRAALETDLSVQARTEAMRLGVESAEAALEQAHIDRLARAERIAFSKYLQGTELHTVARTFASLRASLVKKPATATLNEDGRKLACISDAMYRMSGFKQKLGELPKGACAGVKGMPRAVAQVRDRFSEILDGSERLVSICLRSWSKYPGLCDGAERFKLQARAANDSYTEELRRSLHPPIDVMAYEAEPVTVHCDLLADLDLSMQAIHLSGGERGDSLFSAATVGTDRLSEDDDALLKEVASLPRTYSDLSQRCTGLSKRPLEQGYLRESLLELGALIENTQCVLGKYSKEMGRTPTRYLTTVGKMFSMSSTEPFCHGFVTTLPISEVTESGSSQASR